MRCLLCSACLEESFAALGLLQVLFSNHWWVQNCISVLAGHLIIHCLLTDRLDLICPLPTGNILCNGQDHTILTLSQPKSWYCRFWLFQVTVAKRRLASQKWHLCIQSCLLGTRPQESEFSQDHSSGAVWESRWTSWAVRPNEPSGFRGRKAILNRASALVTTCP